MPSRAWSVDPSSATARSYERMRGWRASVVRIFSPSLYAKVAARTRILLTGLGRLCHRPWQRRHGGPLGPPSHVEAVLVGDDDSERTGDRVDRADDARRAAGHKHAPRRIARGGADRAHERVLADRDEREERRFDADARAAPNGGPLHALGTDRMGVVGDGHARREEHVVFERRELRDVDVAVN